jgi:hypothetical protein
MMVCNTLIIESDISWIWESKDPTKNDKDHYANIIKLHSLATKTQLYSQNVYTIDIEACIASLADFGSKIFEEKLLA